MSGIWSMLENRRNEKEYLKYLEHHPVKKESLELKTYYLNILIFTAYIDDQENKVNEPEMGFINKIVEEFGFNEGKSNELINLAQNPQATILNESIEFFINKDMIIKYLLVDIIILSKIDKSLNTQEEKFINYFFDEFKINSSERTKLKSIAAEVTDTKEEKHSFAIDQSLQREFKYILITLNRKDINQAAFEIPEDTKVTADKKLILSDLEIGQKVVDKSWTWEFRTDDNYSGSGKTKPVTWLIVGKDHYQGAGKHITLLSENLIGKYRYSSLDNNWQESDLRVFLNDTFYNSISNSFKNIIVLTKLPNYRYKRETYYTTEDRIFVLSQTELGGDSSSTHRIGNALAYYSNKNELHLKKMLITGINIEEKYWLYSTRSPDSRRSYGVRSVYTGGSFNYDYADTAGGGVRPALNLSSEIPISVIKTDDGVYEIVW